MHTFDSLVRQLGAVADKLHTAGATLRDRRILFSLVLLKRLTDRYEEECDELLLSGRDPTDPDEHEIMVPEQSRWSTIRAHGRGLGSVLTRACLELERANRSLTIAADFDDARSFGNAWSREEVLSAAVGQLSALRLRNSDLADPADLGRALEEIVQRLARRDGRRADVTTPVEIAELLVELADPRPGMRIADPACGTGGVLTQCARHVAALSGRHLGLGALDLSIHGQEINENSWAVCRMNLALCGLLDARIELGDTLRDPRLVENGELTRFARVVSVPPFDLASAFVQHALDSLAAGGVACLVLPPGFLFRGGPEQAIRRAMVDGDVIEAIVGLPANLFPGTALPAIVLVLHPAKPAARRGRILFVDLRDADPRLGPDVRSRIVATYRDLVEEPHFSRVVSNEEIVANAHNLVIGRYIEGPAPDVSVDVARSLASLREAEAVRDAAAGRMDELLRELGHG